MMKNCFLLLCFMFGAIGLKAQPVSIILSGCDTIKYNGTYTQIDTLGGAPCYQSQSDPLITIQLFSSIWQIGKYTTGMPCVDGAFGYEPLTTDGPTDVTKATIDPTTNCGMSFSIRGVPVPSLGEWGLIALGLLLMIVAVVKIEKSELIPDRESS